MIFIVPSPISARTMAGQVDPIMLQQALFQGDAASSVADTSHHAGWIKASVQPVE
jgi:hypothetical protein